LKPCNDADELAHSAKPLYVWTTVSEMRM